MTAHDALDSIASLIGVIERDGADIMMKDVSFDDSMEELATHKSEFSIDGCGRASCVRPGLGSVMGQRRIGVLKKGNGN